MDINPLNVEFEPQNNFILFFPPDEINYQIEMENWLPCLDNMDKLHQFLGLTDNKPIPDPLRFEKADPLGSRLINTQKQENLASTLCKLGNVPMNFIFADIQNLLSY